VSTQHFVNCRETESDLMKAHQLVAQALNTQLPGASKVKDQRDFLRTGPLPRRSVRPSTLALQAGDTLRLITAKPLAERGARDAAAPADEPCVSYSFMQTDPSQALPLLGCEQVVRHGAQHPNPSERMYANPTLKKSAGSASTLPERDPRNPRLDDLKGSAKSASRRRERIRGIRVSLT